MRAIIGKSGRAVWKNGRGGLAASELIVRRLRAGGSRIRTGSPPLARQEEKKAGLDGAVPRLYLHRSKRRHLLRNINLGPWLNASRRGLRAGHLRSRTRIAKSYRSISSSRRAATAKVFLGGAFVVFSALNSPAAARFVADSTLEGTDLPPMIKRKASSLGSAPEFSSRPIFSAIRGDGPRYHSRFLR